MVRKKVEGNEDQRRAAARQARCEGKAPVELARLTGVPAPHSLRLCGS